MQIGRWLFSPGWQPALATAALFPLLVSLGNWQLDRADQKESLYELNMNRGLLDQVDINKEPSALTSQQDLLWRKVRVTGKYDEENIFLLDNQVVNNVAGYFVFTPIKIEQATKLLLVNRGWVPAGPYRKDIPVIDTSSGNVTINGVIKDPPVTGVVFSDTITEDMGNGYIRLQNINIDKLSSDILFFTKNASLINEDINLII